MDTVMEAVKTFMTGYAFKILGVLIFLLVALWAAGWAQRIVIRTMRKRNIDQSLSGFLGSLTRWMVVLLAVIASLGVFGVETTSFAAVIGAAGLAIGLGFQGSLSNLAAGVMLLVFRPFKSGDVVSVAGNTGKIQEITLFTTTMDTADNRRIIVPNGAVFGAVIENITFHDTRRVDVLVGVAYDASIDETRKVLEGCIQGAEGILADPASQIVLVDLGDSSVNWQVRVWAKTSDFWAVKERVTRLVKMALDEAGIGIPFPQVDVHLSRDAA